MSSIPKRVRVVILGGGLHGLGAFQSIVARGWGDVILFDKKKFSDLLPEEFTPKFDSLFSLFNFDDFKLLALAKNEIEFLENSISSSVSHRNFLMPFQWAKKIDAYMYRSAFALYNYLVKSTQSQPIKSLQKSQLDVDTGRIQSLFSLDDFLVDSNLLQAKIYEDMRPYRSLIKEGFTVESIRPSDDGWFIDYKDAEGQRRTISSLFVINTLGSGRFDFINQHLGPLHSGVDIIETHSFFFKADNIIDPGILLPQDGLRTATRIYPMGDKNLLTIDRKLSHTKSGEIGDKELGIYLRSIKESLRTHFSVNLREDSLKRVDISTKIFLRSKRESDFRMLSKSPYRVFQQRSGRGIAFTIFQPSGLLYRPVAEYIGNQIVMAFGDEITGNSQDGEESF